MIDFNTLLSVSTMGGESLRVEGDQTTGEIAVTSLPTVNIQRAHAGTPDEQNTVAAMTAEMATDQHLMLSGQIADLDAQLNAQTFDSSTGNATGYKVAEGTRERELLQLQRQSKQNALQFLGVRALERLPKVGEAKAAQQTELEAAARRNSNISTLAESLDSNGKPLGRVAAAKLIDEAAQRALADKLVRGG